MLGPTIRTLAACTLVATAALGGSTALAQDSQWEIGLRGNIISARGKPTNDQMGGGLLGRYRVNERWLVGFAVDQMSGDVERPYQLFGNDSPEELDATVDSTIVSAWIEREYGQDRKLNWFWNAGLGFTSPDVDDLAGPLSGGGTFDIATDPGSETILALSGGMRRALSERLGFEVAVRADRHFADWELTDRDNGTTATIGDYSTLGLSVGLHVRF